MSDASQIHLPASFVALYVPPGRASPSASHAEVAARYELCEDLAQTLVPTATQLQLMRDLHAAAVLAQCLQALVGPGAVVERAEARWVVCRLAELLGWELPLFPAEDAAG
ncbi:MAG: ATPase with chaperone activity [Rhodoferax sp.]|nr:ATPase with chaperone activity [Rhodoferax sp.]